MKNAFINTTILFYNTFTEKNTALKIYTSIELRKNVHVTFDLFLLYAIKKNYYIDGLLIYLIYSRVCSEFLKGYWEIYCSELYLGYHVACLLLSCHCELPDINHKNTAHSKH